MEEEAKLEFTITVNWRREDGSIATTQLGRWTAALAARPKMWVCNSRMPSQFSDGIDQDGPAPSDPRDDVYLHGALRLETRAAIRARRAFLKMALRHLRAPHSPGLSCAPS